MPYLTDIDSRAAIKGCRDPLGAQAIWTLLGRHVVGGLTTNTTSVRGFVVLLLGQWFVEKLDEAGSREKALPVFIRWEQLASYARFQAGDTGFRGTMKTRGYLSEGKRVGMVARQQGGGSPSARVMHSASRVVPRSLEPGGAEQSLPRPRRTRGGNVLVRLRAVWGFARRGTLTSGAPEYG